MADKSKIEWTEATWNPITGCSVVSRGCRNCYAMKLAGGRLRHHPSRTGLTDDSKAGPVWNGKVRLNEDWLELPLRWKRPRHIFAVAHGDLFYEQVPDEWIDRVFAAMALAPQHTFQVLTKRPARMRAYLVDPHVNDRVGYQMAVLSDEADHRGIEHEHPGWMHYNRPEGGDMEPLPNVWLGASVEDQATANERIPILLDTPAEKRFLSCEPLLEAINLRHLEYGVHDDFSDCGGHPDPVYPSSSVGVGYTDALTGEYWGGTRTPDGRDQDWEVGYRTPALDWIIAGGESGPKARPSHPSWARSLRDECEAAGVPFFFKQWGEWLPYTQFADAGIDDDPEATRFATMEWVRGRWEDVGRPIWSDFTDGHVDGEQCAGRVGKRTAGRLLDGREHNDTPSMATEARS
jgi:protein gp37